MLRMTGLCKSFGEARILRDAELSMRRGEVLAVLGPSGSGKTTMLRCLNFLEKADSGHLSFRGQELDMAAAKAKEIAAYRRHTAFVFQNFNLFSNKTALQNVTEGLIVARKMPRAEAEDRGMEALRRVGLADRAAFYPSKLSGGQQQRAAIARAIAAEPDIIFFDEPTSALDPELIREGLEVISGLAEEGMTMIIVTHEIRFARRVADSILFMEEGRVLAKQSAEDFFGNREDPRIQSFLGSLDHE